MDDFKNIKKGDTFTAIFTAVSDYKPGYEGSVQVSGGTGYISPYLFQGSVSGIKIRPRPITVGDFVQCGITEYTVLAIEEGHAFLKSVNNTFTAAPLSFLSRIS